MTPADAQDLTIDITAWVHSRADLKALALVGSWARGNARPDSDLDFLILTNALEHFRANHNWIRQIAFASGFRIVSHTGVEYGAVWSCHLLLEPTDKLELSFAAPSWASIDPLDAGTHRVVTEGFRVITDKENLLLPLVGLSMHPNNQDCA